MSFYNEKGYKDLVYLKDIFDLFGAHQKEKIGPNKLKAFCGERVCWYKFNTGVGTLLKQIYLIIVKKATECEYTSEVTSFGSLSAITFLLPVLPLTLVTKENSEEYIPEPTQIQEVLMWSL